MANASESEPGLGDPPGQPQEVDDLASAEWDDDDAGIRHALVKISPVTLLDELFSHGLLCSIPSSLDEAGRDFLELDRSIVTLARAKAFQKVMYGTGVWDDAQEPLLVHRYNVGTQESTRWEYSLTKGHHRLAAACFPPAGGDSEPLKYVVVRLEEAKDERAAAAARGAFVRLPAREDLPAALREHKRSWVEILSFYLRVAEAQPQYLKTPAETLASTRAWLHEHCRAISPGLDSHDHAAKFFAPDGPLAAALSREWGANNDLIDLVKNGASAAASKGTNYG